MKKIKNVYFFPNGNTAVFDEGEEQIPEIQKSWLQLWVKMATEKGYDVTGCEVTLPHRKKARIIKIDEENYNWEIL